MNFRATFLSFFLVVTMPVAAEEIRTVPVFLSADNENAGYEAWRALDGDPGTMWHTQFDRPSTGRLIEAHPIRCGYGYACGHDHHWQSVVLKNNEPGNENNEPGTVSPVLTRPGNNTPCPHELRIDLGGVYPIEGFVYTPRKGRGNGTIRRYEFHAVKEVNDTASEPVLRGVFEGEEMSHRIELPEPISCRYLKFVAISEMNGRPYSSVAELELLCKGYRFRAPDSTFSGRNVPRMPATPDGRAMQEHVDEWNLLAERFRTAQYWKAI